MAIPIPSGRGGVRRRTVRTLLAAVTAVLVSAVVALVAPSAAHAGPAFTNPLNSTGPDPYMTWYNGNYYLMTTPWSGPLTMRKAPTIAALKTATPAAVFSAHAAGRDHSIWAPEFHLLNGPNGQRWYIYYSAGNGDIETQRVHVLESAGLDPLGPYTYKGMIFGSNNWWGIDGSVATINGQLYFTWSGVPTVLWRDSDPHIYLVALANPWTVTGARTAISAPTYDWERQGTPMNEGPVAIQRGGRTFITYSASACQGPDYKIGQLEYTGGNVLSAGSWTKKAIPIFQRNDAAGVYGPAHHGFFKSPDGTEDWIVYHANSSAGDGCGSTRTTRIQKITWNADGTPNLGVPVATSTILAPPAGEPAGPAVAMRLQSYNFNTRYVRHANYDARIDANVSPLADSQWRIVPGLANTAGGYVSFESVNFPGYYLRQSNYDFALVRNDGTAQFAADATFRQVAGLADASAVSYQGYSAPTRYLRHYNYLLRLDPVSTATERADATFRLTA
ncbi:family 43 glycosylhydrolase [Catellatospora sp. KI3]|uniref:family 43 glycosylhydrolase n=1 Tax=Catellatospora sp. KI3 TaxID=3041620 RepID=UPI002482B0BC|nr:family 43 glycosylhydrolase [Catellatospora sp. KI3]MDI1465359.1 family 43 glycosylhydrolase [Catellatospora sp. KI3]